ncbi:MAG: FxsA family protein [Hyphomicrobium sp.]
MLPSFRFALLLVFIAFPLLEIALLIKVGQMIGFWSTIAILIAAAGLGIVVVRQQSLSMVSRAFAAMNEGKPPIGPVFESFVIIVAGFLLMIPGLLTDAVGLLLLIPPVRRGAITWATSGLFAASAGTDSQARRGARGTVVIEGTYERLDDTPRKPEQDH